LLRWWSSGGVEDDFDLGIRVVGILIRGRDDTHEREIKKKFVFN